MVVVVEAIGMGTRLGISSGGDADYGLQVYGFVRIADRVRISCSCGLQDRGLCKELVKFATLQIMPTQVSMKIMNTARPQLGVGHTHDDI